MTEVNVRYPSYPLFVHDPFFSVWSPSDELTGSQPCHWTGASMGILGLVRIDGTCYRWMGEWGDVQPMIQMERRVTATRTTYVFEGDKVRLSVDFLTPALLSDLDVLSRPVTYMTYHVCALDGQSHSVDVYVDFGGALCVNQENDPVNGSRFNGGSLELLTLSAAHPRMLERCGDNHRIEWGRFCLGLPKRKEFQSYVGAQQVSRMTFLHAGKLPSQDDLTDSLTVRHPYFCISAVKSFTVDESELGSARVLLAYDDVFCLEFLHQRLKAYWRRGGASFEEMLEMAVQEADELSEKCLEFDEMLSCKALETGGEDYEKLCVISYRQSIGAHKLAVGIDGRPLFFSKENFSNGCIATVDVTYPSAPLYLWLQPLLLEGMMIPILDYAQVPNRWKFPFAPHDLGTYPLANGQVYGGGEKTEEDQMPVEECGNMLILAAALLRFHGAKEFVRRYWNTLSTWADYLLERGYDPDNQLCTDDFAGHLAHNTNLSLKAILALGGASQLAFAVGQQKLGETYLNAARDFATRWQHDALDDRGCYRLAFDQPGSWSQKYNLVWDKLLGLNLFSEDVIRREMEHYRNIQETYGLPLDNRSTYTKLDWITWSAALSEKQEDFEALIHPLIVFMEQTPDRVPLTDWFFADTAKMRGFQARSVVGGVFLKMLYGLTPAVE